MKFGKEYASQMVLEWQTAYMNYNFLKNLLKDIMLSRVEGTRKSLLNRRLSLDRTFSGLTNHTKTKTLPTSKEDEVILVSAVEASEGSESAYQTMFFKSSEEGGEYELVFFRKLDDEFNKVLKFYVDKVREMNDEAEELSKQMDALIALRIRVNNPLEEFNRVVISPSSASASVIGDQATTSMERIQKVEMRNEEVTRDDSCRRRNKSVDQEMACAKDHFKPAPLTVLDHVKLNIAPISPISTLKNVLHFSNRLSFSKEELRTSEEKLKKALVEFYQKLRLLKNFSFLNQLAFSKIMKKYDKITSRSASKSYLAMVDNSDLGSSDEILRLIEKVEATYVKHFSNGNRSKGMKYLRHEAKRERHRVTYSFGLLSGCSIALIIAIICVLRAGDHVVCNQRNGDEESEDSELRSNQAIETEKYMSTIFPLYSLFGYIVLHMLMYAGNIFCWKRFRVNYPFIFEFKQGTELSYRQILLVASALSTLTLAATLSNLDMEMDQRTQNYQTLTELVPLILVIVVLLITLCPFNIIYRSSRFSFITSVWRCLCAPLYKVKLLDFFLADQLTSQIQAIRSILFYVFYYSSGDFKNRTITFGDTTTNITTYELLYIVVAIIPFWVRFLQCVRRLFEEKDLKQGVNSLKYLSTVVALVMRTLYEQKRNIPGGSPPIWLILAAVTSGITTIFNTYWDIVIDWGLLTNNSKNRWLRDKLLVPNKIVYFVAIVINILLRLVWMQLILGFTQTSFLHRKAFRAIVASLEIIRRGIWSFFRLENEQVNNVGKYRAFKSVPLPFNYGQGI